MLIWYTSWRKDYGSKQGSQWWCKKSDTIIQDKGYFRHDLNHYVYFKGPPYGMFTCLLLDLDDVLIAKND